MSASSWIYAHRYSVLMPSRPGSAPNQFGWHPSQYGEAPIGPGRLVAASSFAQAAQLLLASCPGCRVLEPNPVLDRNDQPTGQYVVLVNGPAKDIGPRMRAIMELAMQKSEEFSIAVRENPITEIAVSGVWWTFLPVIFGSDS
jgi:hypothetical protein